MAFLQTAAEYLTDRHAQHADLIERFHQIIQLAGPGDDLDFRDFHDGTLPFSFSTAHTHDRIGQHFAGIFETAEHRAACQD